MRSVRWKGACKAGDNRCWVDVLLGPAALQVCVTARLHARRTLSQLTYINTYQLPDKVHTAQDTVYTAPYEAQCVT